MARAVGSNEFIQPFRLLMFPEEIEQSDEQHEYVITCGRFYKQNNLCEQIFSQKCLPLSYSNPW